MIIPLKEGLKNCKDRQFPPSLLLIITAIMAGKKPYIKEKIVLKIKLEKSMKFRKRNPRNQETPKIQKV